MTKHKPGTPYPPAKLTDYLTPEDRRMVERIADQMEALIVEHKREGTVPIVRLQQIRVQLEDLAREADALPLSYAGIEIVSPSVTESVTPVGAEVG